MKVLIMAGGTGGHVFPALEIARYLQTRRVAVEWLGTPQGLEATLVPPTQIPIHYLTISPLRGKNWRRWFFLPWTLLQASWQAYRLFRIIKPDIALGMGGFASGPGGLIAIALRIPLYIHEQNAVPGLTNRWLSRFAKRIFSAFPSAFTNQSRVTCVGNPVRPSVLKMLPPKQRFRDLPKPLHILVLGGSQGAQFLNQTVPAAIAQLLPTEAVRVWHQSGKLQKNMTEALYRGFGIEAEISAFIDDMATAYQFADLVICRAGALTISEVMAAGVASILIPYPFAADNHQQKNALFLAEKNAAIALSQEAVNPTVLAKTIKSLYYHRQNLLAMAEAAYALRKSQAAEVIGNNLLAMKEPQ